LGELKKVGGGGIPRHKNCWRKVHSEALTNRWGGCFSCFKITRGKIMKNIFVKFLKYLTKKIEREESPETYQKLQQSVELKSIFQEQEEKLNLDDAKHEVILLPQGLKKETTQEPTEEQKNLVQISHPINFKKNKKKLIGKSRNKIIREETEFLKDPRDIRDVMELMEIPFVSLSKNRTNPIIYGNSKSKVKVSCHPPYYIASIYDWDIIIFVSSKLQETINSASDIPPRTLVVSRNELIKAIYRHIGKTTDNEIEAALNRLSSTFIETTVHNEDCRYRSGFSFLDNWGYTERKDIKQFRITLSEWLYEITCSRGALLKLDPEYFKITSGFKRFLYRTARKHVGNQNESWAFSVETLYKKSGS